MFSLKRVSRAMAQLHRWKNHDQYLGRYSVEKLYVLGDYQQHTSPLRIVLVLLSAPLPVLCVMLVMDAVELGDPTADLKHNSVTLSRSIFSHTVMTFAMLLSLKRCVPLPDGLYSFLTMSTIPWLVGISLELVFLPVMVLWRFPVPFRELIGVLPFSILLCLFHLVFASNVISQRRDQLKLLLPVLGAQLTLFYAFVGLSIAFAYMPLSFQAVLVLIFPVIKVFIKNWLWKSAGKLDDLSTDVTICMVEISGALYQTVCLQHVQSRILGVLLMVMDFAQAVGEVHLYMAHDYVVDNQSTLLTAMRIVESSLFPGNTEKTASATTNQSPPTDSELTSLKARFRRWCWWTFRSTSKVHAAPFKSVKRGSRIPEEDDETRRRRVVRSSFLESAQSLPILPQAVAFSQTHKQLLDLAAFAATAVRTPAGTEGEPPVIATGDLQIDGLSIARRDQARELEQYLQLLFSSEVLLFVEFMKVLMPVLYGTYVGVAWHLPNAKYNFILKDTSHADMIESVVSSYVYACLEAMSPAITSWLMQRKYGINALYQLAFVLENYWMNLHGKLIGCFITIINSATVHQGIDFSFRLTYDS